MATGLCLADRWTENGWSIFVKKSVKNCAKHIAFIFCINMTSCIIVDMAIFKISLGYFQSYYGHPDQGGRSA